MRHVFIVSFDGGKPAVMQQSRMPHLERLRAEGAGTWAARTVFPSITLVSHTAMLTGVGPAKHKVDWNDWQPAKGALAVPTVFSLVKKHDKKWFTGLFAGKEKFAHLLVPGSLDAFALPGYSARKVVRAAADFIVEERPRLCFLHFSDGDGAGHSKGWGTPEQKQAFADADDALGTLMRTLRRAGIAERSVVLVSADHGGHAKTHGSALSDDMNIPWFAWGAAVRPGVALRGPVHTFDTAATALWLLGVPLPAALDGQPVREAFAL